MPAKYSLWRVDHESIYTVNAEKIRDTNSIKEVKKWQSESYYNVASLYREEDEINANYLQTFEAD